MDCLYAEDSLGSLLSLPAPTGDTNRRIHSAISDKHDTLDDPCSEFIAHSTLLLGHLRCIDNCRPTECTSAETASGRIRDIREGVHRTPDASDPSTYREESSFEDDVGHDNSGIGGEFCAHASYYA